MYCQEDYPKLTLINNDTLVLFTPNQVSKMNIIFIELDRAKAINNNLKQELALRTQSEEAIKESNEHLWRFINFKDSIGKDRLYQIKEYKKIIEKQKKDIKILKKTRPLYIVGSMLIGGYLTYKIGKL